jgi:hypothetical protein
VSAITIDRTEFPFVRIAFTAAPTDDEFTVYLRGYQALLDQSQPYAVLVVTSPHLPMTRAKHARAQADSMAQNREAMARLILGVGLVLPSLVTRGVLKAILNWQPMPCPHAVFQHEADGEAWVRARLGPANTSRRGSPGRHAVG